MPRTPAARRLLTASVLTVLTSGVLLGTSGCLSTMPQAHAPLPTVSPTARPSASTAVSPRSLTQAQAQAALVTATDLGEPWAPTQGAATWRDGLLKATTEAPDCKRLLDALYADDLFGGDAGTRAVTGLDDAMDQAQLRYQVLDLPVADVDRTLAWMKTLPRTCGTFTAVTEHGAVQNVHVTEAALPNAGDARQGLRAVLSGENADGEQTVLTLDVAAVRIGDDTIALTHGGLGDVSADATNGALQLGVQRLAEVRKQARVQV
ncbi:hypothetical protein [Streptomyces cylindrosporus]|uniref:Lipoprotein n=1 Tax=Streptomyces cylindrosporus TaxID=2927583 RepID=A0ABS9YCC4_9ACTN|nr:hypothetical protein [Streptomyces cylindrosporus]MCI3274845.1 hypothetical protein [Streptomyces cylindrosporus]